MSWLGLLRDVVHNQKLKRRGEGPIVVIDPTWKYHFEGEDFDRHSFDRAHIPGAIFDTDNELVEEKKCRTR